MPPHAQGQSLRKLCENPKTAGHPAISYKGQQQTIRTDSHRLILHPNGFAELYDHRSPDKETVNVADKNPEIVTELKQVLAARLRATPNPQSTVK